VLQFGPPSIETGGQRGGIVYAFFMSFMPSAECYYSRRRVRSLDAHSRSSRSRLLAPDGHNCTYAGSVTRYSYISYVT
jgi:hypothetical protein